MRKGRENMKNDTYDLAAEINGVAMTITGLSNQLDCDKTDSLTAPALYEALHSVSVHLRRIADELAEMS